MINYLLNDLKVFAQESYCTFICIMLFGNLNILHYSMYNMILA